MPVLFNIATGATTPIYKQITDQVRLAVATAAAQPGNRSQAFEHSRRNSSSTPTR
jgi:hypothetical protein